MMDPYFKLRSICDLAVRYKNFDNNSSVKILIHFREKCRTKLMWVVKRKKGHMWLVTR